MYFIVFITFVLLCIKIASKISNKNFEEIFIIGYILYSASIILSGYILSELNIWNSTISWSIVPFLIIISFHQLFSNSIFQAERLNASSFKITGRAIQKFHEVYKSSTKTERLAFTILLISFILIHLIQLSITFYSPPNEWDSMTGHLNRILYFLQNGSLKHFIGTNWNIDTYPKAFSSIQAYPFLMSNWNEHFFKLPNLSAYWILFIGTYGILKRLAVPFINRVFCASMVLFLPIAIIQSTSTDTDIILAAYLVSYVYFLFSFKQSQQTLYLYLAAIAFSIALSHKITFVFSFFPLFVLLVYIVRNITFISWKYSLKHFILAHLFFILIITLPTGYISNLNHYGHPIGPTTATQHQSIERAGNFKNLLAHGSRNFIRYNLDLINLDGLRNIGVVENFQKSIKPALRRIDEKFNIGLEQETSFTIIPFSFNRRFEFYNGTPIYGVIFIILIIPSIIVLFLRRSKSVYYFFIAAFLLHMLALSFTAPYDPWKGRYMLSSFVFVIPILGNWLNQNSLFQNNRLGKIYLIFSSILISFTGLSTIIFHKRALPFGAYNKPSIFKISRMEALTISRPDIYQAYAKFDSIVPLKAIVALATINDDYEYPLWGPHFSRRLIPINPFEQGLQKIPMEADYLFFAKSVIKPIAGDIRLGTNTSIKEGVIVPGEDYYIRKLK
jgi:hypothetical protein